MVTLLTVAVDTYLQEAVCHIPQAEGLLAIPVLIIRLMKHTSLQMCGKTILCSATL